jgi:hypothetical protein
VLSILGGKANPACNTSLPGSLFGAGLRCSLFGADLLTPPDGLTEGLPN